MPRQARLDASGTLQEIIENKCRKENINSQELHLGGRRRIVSKVRADLAHTLMSELGIPSAEIARHLGVSTSAIVKLLQRG